MKKVYKLKLGLTRLTPTALVEKGRNHVDCCTGNPVVVLPTDFLTDLSAACDALESASKVAMDNGGRNDILRRNERTAVVETMIRTLAGYVSAQCMGDPEKIIDTGFALQKPAEPVGRLDAVEKLRAQRGLEAGEIDLRWGGKRGRVSYGVYLCEGNPKEEGDWKWLRTTTRNAITVHGLEPDRMYYFRVRANSAAGRGKLSDSASSKAA